MKVKKRPGPSSGTLDIEETVWLNRCFVCSRYVSKEQYNCRSDRDLGKQLKQRLKFLEYLLKGSGLYREISEIIKSGKLNDKEEIRFCESCDKLCESAANLTLQLEDIQLKLIKIVIIASSACKRTDEVSKKNPPDIIENRLQKTEFHQVCRRVRQYLRETEIQGGKLFPNVWQPKIVLKRHLSDEQPVEKEDALKSSFTISTIVKQEVDNHDDDASFEDNGYCDLSDGQEGESDDYADPISSGTNFQLEGKQKEENDSKLEVTPDTDAPQSPPRKKKRIETSLEASCIPLQSSIITPDAFDPEQALRKLKAENPGIIALHFASSYTCVICKFFTDKPAYFEQHLRDHENDEEAYRCEATNCGRSFSNVQYFIFHLQQHCTRKRRCTDCTAFLPILQMSEHLKSHFSRLFQCEWCDHNFGRFLELIRHFRLHSGVDFACQWCADNEEQSSKRYDLAELQKHFDAHHAHEAVEMSESKQSQIMLRPNTDSEKVFRCPFCPETFDMRRNLTKHVTSVHNRKEPKHADVIVMELDQEITEISKTLSRLKADSSNDKIFESLKPWKHVCLSCDFKTDVPMTINQHLQSHENDDEEEESYKCPDDTCERSFKTKQYFVFHLQQHCTRIRRCTECNVKLPVLQMEAHLKTHFDRLFKCEFCDWSFPTFPELINHTKFHAGMRMKCQLCTDPKLSMNLYSGRELIRKHLLEYHKMEEMQLKCGHPGCSKSFLSETHLQEHVKKHKRSHVCDICSKIFSTQSYLYFHVKDKHADEKELMEKLELQRGPTKRKPKKKSKIRNEAEKMLAKMESEETSKDVLAVLKKTHHPFFVCLTCKFKHQRFYAIMQHLRVHEADEKTYFCPQPSCAAAFTNQQSFIYHLQNHCGRYRMCENCDAHLPLLEMNEHLKLHYEKVYQCQLCEIAFGKFEEMLFHERSYHSQADLFCQLCTDTESTFRRYATRNLLYEHLSEAHNMEDLIVKCRLPERKKTLLALNEVKVHDRVDHSLNSERAPKQHRKKKEALLKVALKRQKKYPPKGLEKAAALRISDAEKLLLKMEAKDSSIFINSYQNGTSKCLICNRFNTKRSYAMEQHLRIHEEEFKGEKPHECVQPNCGKKFSYELSYIFHLQNHSTRKRKCDFCGLLLSVIDMKEHLQSHCEEIYHCTFCDWSYDSYYKLVLHLRYHSKAQQFKCDLCTEPEMILVKYHTYPSLVQHLYEYHKKTDVQLKCPFAGCENTFFDMKLLRKHKLEHIHAKKLQTGAPKFILCGSCPEKFKSKATLLSHEITVHGKEPFKCDICKDPEVTFSSVCGLKQHVNKVHNNQRWKCSICNAELKTKQFLIQHEEAHLDERNYQCDVCSSSFNTMILLIKHKKLHGEKKFKCEHCPKAFTIKRYLDEHLLTHTKERPFVCETCGDSFNQRFSLTSHKKKKHGYVNRRSTMKLPLEQEDNDFNTK